VPRPQRNVVRSGIYRDAIGLTVHDFDAEGSLAYETLDYRKNEAMLSGFYKRRNDMLVPEELSRS
jgi:hypothetical protein